MRYDHSLRIMSCFRDFQMLILNKQDEKSNETLMWSYIFHSYGNVLWSFSVCFAGLNIHRDHRRSIRDRWIAPPKSSNPPKQEIPMPLKQQLTTKTVGTSPRKATRVFRNLLFQQLRGEHSHKHRMFLSVRFLYAWQGWTVSESRFFFFFFFLCCCTSKEASCVLVGHSFTPVISSIVLPSASLQLTAL